MLLPPLSPSAVSYVASKHAVAGITKAAALDCAPHRIHVNAVCPGFTATDMTTAQLSQPALAAHFSSLHPFRGLGTVDDIAAAVLFLASPDCSWITGVMMPVDGGFTVA